MTQDLPKASIPTAEEILEQLNAAFRIDPVGMRLLAINKVQSTNALCYEHPYFPVAGLPPANAAIDAADIPVIDGYSAMNMILVMLYGKVAVLDWSDEPGANGRYDLRGFKLIDFPSSSEDQET
jgi:hypothetical protein